MRCEPQPNCITGGLFFRNICSGLTTYRTTGSACGFLTLLKIRTSILDELSALEIQSDFISTYDDIHDPQIIEILSKRIDEYRYVRTGVLLPDGSSANTDMAQINLSHRDYFKQALQGKSVVSDVLENMTDNPKFPLNCS